MPTIDPEFQKWIPAPTKKEHDGLESLIVAEGCRDSIVTWNDIIIDGHTRYNICEANDIPYKTKAMNFPDRNAAMAWMIRNQCSRRNLTPSQGAMLAAKLSTLANGERPTCANLHTLQENAEKTGVSRRSVASAKKVESSPVKELSRMVIDGEVPVSVAEQASKQPEAKVRQAVKKGPEAVKALAKSPPATTDPFAHYPEHTQDAFRNGETFSEALTLIRSIVGHVHRLAGDGKPDTRPIKGGELLRGTLQSAITDLRNLKELLNGVRPWAVCPYCEAKDKKCAACKGLGWCCKSTYINCPHDYKPRVKGMVRE